MRGFQGFLLVGLCFLAFKAGASPLLVISDIDDTLKPTHVRSTLDKVANALRTDLLFPAMPELLRGLQQNGAEVYYVSAAPEALIGGAHRDFLSLNGFPDGELFLSPGFTAADKLPTLRRILKKEKPRTVILFGDNGENDAVNSETLVRENPGIRFITFIRWDYEPGRYADFFPDQIPFVTAGDAALNLRSQGFLTDEQTKETLIGANPDVQTLGLPDWVDCQGYRANLPAFPFDSEDANQLEESLNARCGVNPNW